MNSTGVIRESSRCYVNVACAAGGPLASNKLASLELEQFERKEKKIIKNRVDTPRHASCNTPNELYTLYIREHRISTCLLAKKQPNTPRTRVQEKERENTYDRVSRYEGD